MTAASIGRYDGKWIVSHGSESVVFDDYDDAKRLWWKLLHPRSSVRSSGHPRALPN